MDRAKSPRLLVLIVLCFMLCSCMSDASIISTLEIATVTPIENLILTESKPLIPTQTQLVNSPIPAENDNTAPTTLPERLSDLSKWGIYSNANYIKVMLLDQEGYLWAGGSGGLVRWKVKDGSYVKYTSLDGLAGNNVTTILEDQDGIIWVGTQGSGISAFDGSQWKTYNSSQYLPSKRITSSTLLSDGRIWFGTFKGISQFDHGEWSLVDMGELMTQSEEQLEIILMESVGDDIYVVNYRNEFYVYTNNAWKRIETPLFHERYDIQYITALAKTSEGKLWVGAEGAIYLFDGLSWKEIKILNTESGSGISSIFSAANGLTWFGFAAFGDDHKILNREVWGQVPAGEYPGVYSFDGSNWVQYTFTNGLGENDIRAITAGADGDVYFGTFSYGISVFDGSNWNQYRTDDDIPTNLLRSMAILKDDSKWFNTPDGVLYFDKDSWTSLGQVGDVGKPDRMYLGDSGKLWFTSYEGVTYFDGENWITFPKDISPCLDWVWVVKELSSGEVIVGGDDISCIYDGTKWSPIPYLNGTGVLDILEDSSNVVWFMTTDNGILKKNGDTWEQYGTFRYIVGAEAPDSSKWFGSKNFLVHYDGENWIEIKGPSLMDAGWIRNIMFISGGDMLASTDGGLLYFDGIHWQIISEGLPDLQITAISKDKSGIIWVTTLAGLITISP